MKEIKELCDELVTLLDFYDKEYGLENLPEETKKKFDELMGLGCVLSAQVILHEAQHHDT